MTSAWRMDRVVIPVLWCMLVGVGCSSLEAEPAGLAFLRETFAAGHFVAYTPSGLNPLPEQFTPATPEGIRQDLTALRPWFDVLVTYSCNSQQGLQYVVPLAEEAGLKVIVGIWDPKSVLELNTAVQLAREHPGTVIGIICGNEALQFGRITWEELDAALSLLRAALPDMPFSVTETITQYGDDDLREKASDFLTPNCHWLFAGGDPTDVNAAVQWLQERIIALQEIAPGKPILAKEHGVPSSPEPFSEELQAAYWQACIGAIPNTRDLALAFFEAHNLPWKSTTNPSQWGPSEAHWGGFAGHQPKPVMEVLPKVDR